MPNASGIHAPLIACGNVSTSVKFPVNWTAAGYAIVNVEEPARLLVTVTVHMVASFRTIDTTGLFPLVFTVKPHAAAL